MRQTLFYIPEYIGDVPVFGVGLLLGIFAVFSTVVLVSLFCRPASRSDAWGYLPILALGVGLCFFLPRLCEEQGLPIRGYGTFMLLAVVISTAVAAWRGHRLGVNPEKVVTLIFWGFVPGIIGARLYYVVEYWDQIKQESFGATLSQAANMADGGLVVYGGFIGATVGFLAFIWLKKMPTLATLDLLAPSVALGAAIGRLGCFMNGCCYGGVCDLDWKVYFPWESPAHVHQVQHGETFSHGLKLPSPAREGLDGAFADPIIAEVERGSAAEREGLEAGDEIISINGQRIASLRQAQWALLNAYKLDLLIKSAASATDTFHWIIEDPFSDCHLDQDGQLSIHRVEIIDADSGPSPVVSDVARHSWAARPDAGVRPGLQPGQKIVSVNGRPVTTTAEIHRLILEQRDSPWLSIRTQDRASPIEWVMNIPRGGPEPVHPTQLYSSIDGFLLFLLLVAFAPFCRRDGAVWAMMLTIYPITRILLEEIRTDEPAVFAGMTTAQNFSLVLLACAIALWLYILRRPPTTAFAQERKTTVEK